MIPTENIDITRLAITLAAVAPFLALLLAAGVKDLKRRDMSETFQHWLIATAFLALIVNTIEGFVFRIMNGSGLWPAIVATFWGIVFNVGAAFLLERLLRRLRRNRDAIRQSAVDILPALPLALGAVTALAAIALIPLAAIVIRLVHKEGAADRFESEGVPAIFIGFITAIIVMIAVMVGVVALAAALSS